MDVLLRKSPFCSELTQILDLQETETYYGKSFNGTRLTLYILASIKNKIWNVFFPAILFSNGVCTHFARGVARGGARQSPPPPGI